jgi:hypothetical protein
MGFCMGHLLSCLTLWFEFRVVTWNLYLAALVGCVINAGAWTLLQRKLARIGVMP